MLYEDSVPTNVGELEWIANNFGISVTDVDIWDVAKHHEKPTYLGNISTYKYFSQGSSRSLAKRIRTWR